MQTASVKPFAVLLISLLMALPAIAGEPIVNPWVTTDKSVNCFSDRTIVADVTAGLTGPQDQAIAIFSFFRRTMFPFTNRNEYPYPVNDQQHMFDLVRAVNVYGYSLCTQTSAMFASLLKGSGLFEDARCVGVPGHGTAEVKWNGRWHFMDPIVGAYVFRRGAAREIAGIEEIVADTTLFTRAVAEGRAGMPFCQWDGGSVYPEQALPETDTWFTYRKYGLMFLLGALPKPDPWEETVSITHSMAFSLRPGFRLTRMWDNLPGMYNLSYDFHRGSKKNTWSPSPAILPPHHPDGGREARDTVNFPLIKPYRKTINGRASYHYYANGLLAYEDNFSDKRIFQAADSLTGLSVTPAPDGAGNMLRCADSVSDGSAVFRFEAPYVFVGGAVSGRAQVRRGSWAAVYMDVGDSGLWLALGVIEKGGDFSFEIPAALLDQRYAFSIKIRLHDGNGPGSVNLREFKAQAVCQLNMYSLPFLAPGENKVTVLAGRIPQGASLAVTYRWQEQGWDREDRRLVREAGASYSIRVAGEDYPRMKEITMECIPE
ncbi:MAG TPA: hypothetical protein VM123_14890 [archaeon]|nr:hypothetical protein [archaeon]